MFACILTGGPDLVIEVDGREYLFEDHPYMGPCPLNQNGEPKMSRVPMAFWRAVTLWKRQGSRADELGRAIWEDGPITPFEELTDGYEVEHIGGRHYRLTKENDDR